MTKTKEQYEGMNLHQRLHAVMKAVDYIQKGKGKGNGLQYTFVSHDSVTAAIRTPCVEWGIVYYPVEMTSVQDGNRTQVSLKLRFVNIDDKNDFIETASFGYGIDSQDKGPGKAISYAVKYALLKSFGLETGDDPENDSIDHKPLKEAMTPEWPKDHPISKAEADVIYNSAKEELQNLEDMDSIPKWKANWGAKVKQCSSYQVNAISKLFKEKETYFINKNQLNGAQH